VTYCGFKIFIHQGLLMMYFIYINYLVTRTFLSLSRQKRISIIYYTLLTRTVLLPFSLLTVRPVYIISNLLSDYVAHIFGKFQKSPLSQLMLFSRLPLQKVSLPYFNEKTEQLINTPSFPPNLRSQKEHTIHCVFHS